jgi:hypothetical protein
MLKRIATIIVDIHAREVRATGRSRRHVGCGAGAGCLIGLVASKKPPAVGLGLHVERVTRIELAL